VFALRHLSPVQTHSYSNILKLNYISGGNTCNFWSYFEMNAVVLIGRP